MTETPTNVQYEGNLMDKPQVYIHSESSDEQDNENDEYNIFNESYNNDHNYFGEQINLDSYDNNSNDMDNDRYAVANPNHISPPPAQNGLKRTQLTSPNSGRLINFGSGFKIPKRSSQETLEPPPEKKSKTIEELDKSPEDSLKLKKLAKKPSIEKSKTAPQPSFDPKSLAAPVVKMKIPKKIPKAIEELEHKQESNTVQSQPQKPKAQKRELQESSIFMDAFNVAASRPQRQRTNPTNTSQSTTPSSLNTQHINKLNTYSVSSPTNATFDSSKITNKNSNVIVDSKTTTTTTPSSDVYNNKDSRSNEPLSEANETRINEVTSVNKNENVINVPSCPKSNLSEPGLKKTNKKKVIWADHCSKELVQLSFFYLEESERVIKRNAFRGGDIAKIEKLNERELRNSIGKLVDESNENEIPWPSSLIPIDLPNTIVCPVVNSAEKLIQQEREKNTLAMLPFKQFLPDSPGEPDPVAESYSYEIKTIPLDDTNEIEHIVEEVQQPQITLQPQVPISFPNTQNILALVNNLPDESTENLKNILKNLQKSSDDQTTKLNIPLISQLPNKEHEKLQQRQSRWSSSWRGGQGTSRPHNHHSNNRSNTQGGYNNHNRNNFNNNQTQRDFNRNSNNSNNYRGNFRNNRFNDNHRNSPKYDDNLNDKPKAQGKWI